MSYRDLPRRFRAWHLVAIAALWLLAHSMEAPPL